MCVIVTHVTKKDGRSFGQSEYNFAYLYVFNKYHPNLLVTSEIEERPELMHINLIAKMLKIPNQRHSKHHHTLGYK